MIVTVWTRHKSTCPFKNDRAYKQCRCPKHLQYSLNGKQIRTSAKTAFWSTAARKARSIEERHEAALLGKKPAQPEAITLEHAVDRYLAEKKFHKVSDEFYTSLERIFRKELLQWAQSQGAHYLEDLTTSKLQEYRITWTRLRDITARKRTEKFSAFFNFCLNNEWIRRNPVKGLSTIRVTQKPTDYFPAEEYRQILKAVSRYGRTGDEKGRVKAMLQLLRWSGLGISDAATLERSRLDKQGVLFLYRHKTGVNVVVPLPPRVARDLRNVPPGPKPNPNYFFWSGTSKRKSLVNDWIRALGRLFELAAIKRDDGQAKRCHVHMLRDTFAVECLLAGVPLEQVSILLGHSSIKTTEKHYAPFVKARQEQMIANVKKTWPKGK